MIVEKLRVIVQPYLQGEVEIGLDSHLVNDLALDSIDIVDVMISLEDAFNLRIKDKELDGFKIVRDIVHFIEMKLNAQ